MQIVLNSTRKRKSRTIPPSRLILRRQRAVLLEALRRPFSIKQSQALDALDLKIAQQRDAVVRPGGVAI